MNLIRLAIDRPIAVIAAVLMAVMFGYVALLTIPIQLAPDVSKPVISITTEWPGAAPAEIEREIVNEQEEVMKGLEGLERIESSSEDGQATVTLEFGVGTNMDRALLFVANRLQRVPSYPPEADEPTISASDEDANAIAWFVITREAGNDRPIESFGKFAEDTIQDRLQRVQGVARVDVFGGADPELQIIVEPQNLARYRLTVPEVVDTLREAGISLTAGDVAEGKRRYVVRSEGEFHEPADVAAVVLRSIADPESGRLGRVTVADIADVRFGVKEPTATIRVLGESALVARAIREIGSNVIETMDGIRAAVDELNAHDLPNEGLQLRQVYDETIYINSAISLVTQNIYIGGTLAALMLLLFLRSFGATLIVSVAIPVSVIASFVAMAAMGRSINVVSLAGIAFAVGMVVDAAIVVLENIYRLRQEGKSAAKAAYEGAAQVWGAILVSALTTVMVFIPILTMQLEVGQLFRDIAVAISVAVILSLIVAVTLIPAMATRLLGGRDGGSLTMMRIPVVDDIASAFSRAVLATTRRIVASRLVSLAVVVVVTLTAGTLAWTFLPKLEYLPEGNQNLVFGIVIPPPGYNLGTMTDIATDIEGAVRPLWASETGPEQTEEGLPKLDQFFFVAFRGNMFVGGSAMEMDRAAELIGPMSAPVFREPGTFGFVSQPSIFGGGIGGGRTIDFDISGPDLEQVLAVALRATGRIAQVMPREAGHQFRPDPGLELGAPEIRLEPDRVRLADAGVTARNFALSVDAFNDGLRIAEITVDGSQMDLTLMGPEGGTTSTQGINALPIVTADGQILPASALSAIEVTAGPIEIRRVERQRTVTLLVNPSSEMPLEVALELLQNEVMAPLEAEGLPPGVQMRLSGTADQLTETFDEMVLDLMLAIVIVYLVMAVLFESFVFPLVILFAVPLAAAGGVAGLVILNQFTFQPLDMLTLLGFVILVGIVVNNAILLVHQTLYELRTNGHEPIDAIVEATKNRLRPIFMSTLTSVFGMLPLVLFPGAGSELYRGLGSVVVGGLSLSAVLTLLLIPPLMALVLRTAPGTARRGSQSAEAAASPAE